MLPAGIRRSGRIPKEIAILLIGSDVDGKVFAEQTRTITLSRHGAGVASQYRLSPEQEMIVHRLDTDTEAEVRIVGQIESRSQPHIYGVAFLDADINFWGVDFPPATESENAASRCLLECSRCRYRETVDHSDIEWEVYEINACIARYCKTCGSSTNWRRAADDPGEKSLPPNAEPEPELTTSQAPATEPKILMPAVPPQNRRKHVRAKVSLTACVRRPGFDDDIVTCEDMSRGGFRFITSKRYYADSFIEIAVPYSPNAPNIFVTAEIVYVLPLPGHDRFRCGAAYSRGHFE